MSAVDAVRSDRTLRNLTIVSAVLVVAGPATRAVDYLGQRTAGTTDEPAWWARLFDLSTEANVPTWWSSLLLAALAGLFVLAAFLHRSTDSVAARTHVALAAVALTLSVDEATAVHEEVLGAVGDAVVDTGGLLTFAWVVPGAVLAGAVGLTLLRATTGLPGPVRRGLVAGGAVFLTGALGVETVTGAILDERGHDRAYVLATTVEEGLEMLGVLLALGAARLSFTADTGGGRPRRLTLALRSETS